MDKTTQREIKFKFWHRFENKMYEVYNLNGDSATGELCSLDLGIEKKPSRIENGTLMQYTGLKDKNGKKGYFDCDIWEIKNYKYTTPHGIGFNWEKCNLRFVLKQGLLEVKYELINPPEDLKHISLNTIFNLPLKSGERMYVDDNRKKLEIIGNKFEHKHLLNSNNGCIQCGSNDIKEISNNHHQTNNKIKYLEFNKCNKCGYKFVE